MSIVSAIQNRQLLSFVYDGYPRVVEPHLFGVDGKGHEALRAYQIDGSSSSGAYVGWKLFHSDKMRGLAVLTQQFAGARPEYNPNDKAFSRVHARL